ncbi:MAG TPA: cupin domain-containing protein [Terriglobales bacterium]|nr:cupin domain-containing protein [Terriglobales bacterium]
MLSAEDVKRLLNLEPLEREGGFFAESYRSRDILGAGVLAGLGAPRALASAIYYLLEPGTFSALHRLRSDEIYHFYLGDPVEMLLLDPERGARVLRLGGDLLGGDRPQAVVPAHVWQGSRLVAGGRWALLGTTMAPGYDPADFELGARADLIARWPEQRERIEALTGS